MAGSTACVAATAKVVWWFRVAPPNVQILANKQLGSLGPLHGSVLVDKDGLVWWPAGPCSWTAYAG